MSENNVGITSAEIIDRFNKLKNQIEENSNVKENMDLLCDIMEEEILNSGESEENKKQMLKNLRSLYSTETNIMLVGATGCGKSSTINALFNVNSAADADNIESDYVEIAKVGSSADPETKNVERYKIGNLILWDTPGLGDGTNEDESHKEIITNLLRAVDDEGKALIDLVLVILDGSTKDLGTSYKILNEVIIPELKDDTARILVALNQADIAMKTGRHWDYEKNKPDEVLVKYLEEKVQSIKERIKSESDLDIDPVYYCAGYAEESGAVVKPYNLSKLLYYILNALPAEKRVAIIEGISNDKQNYESNDDDEDYNEEIKGSIYSTFDTVFNSCVNFGKKVLGIPGAVIGGVVGSIAGCFASVFDSIFN